MMPGLSAALAVLILSVVVAVALLGWGGSVGRVSRLGLTLMAAGLLWASPARFLGGPPGFGDVMFLAGIAIYLIAAHWRPMWKALRANLDALDGERDGRIKFVRRSDG